MEGNVIENKPNIIIYGVDLEDGQWFQKKLHEMKGNSGSRLFREMIFRYESDAKFALMYKELDELKSRIEELEDSSGKKTIKTFGGGEK